MRLLICDDIGKKGRAVLDMETEIVYDLRTGLSHDGLQQIVSNYDGIIIRSRTQLTRDILENAPRLKVIGRAGVGLDNVDLETAHKKGIIVVNTPDENTISTCEHTIALILALSRHIPQAHASLKQNEWSRKRFVGTELYGKVLGIVGLGRIGGEVAKRMSVFGMTIIAHDPFVSSGDVVHGVNTIVNFDDLCSRSDYISIHVPLTDQTKYLFNKEAFLKMKQGVRIINCARGGIVHEGDLYDAIVSGKVKGAALDVFEIEPPRNNPLLTRDEVVAVPHLGAATDEARENVGIAVAKQVADALLGRGIRNASCGNSVCAQLKL